MTVAILATTGFVVADGLPLAPMYANAPIISAKCRFERLGHGVSSEVVVRSIYPVLEVIAVFFALRRRGFGFAHRNRSQWT